MGGDDADNDNEVELAEIKTQEEKGVVTANPAIDDDASSSLQDFYNSPKRRQTIATARETLEAHCTTLYAFLTEWDKAFEVYCTFVSLFVLVPTYSSTLQDKLMELNTRLEQEEEKEMVKRDQEKGLVHALKWSADKLSNNSDEEVAVGGENKAEEKEYFQGMRHSVCLFVFQRYSNRTLCVAMPFYQDVSQQKL